MLFEPEINCSNKVKNGYEWNTLVSN